MFRLDTLFIEMRANTTDFERGITGVGRELDKLGDFIQKKPVIAASAFASSLLLVGAAATKMAREVDQGIRAATASMPVLQGRTEDMRQEIERLSRETGKSQASLSEAFAAAAKTGVTGFTQLRDVVQSAVRISEATGEDVIAIIGGLDLALDGFNISASRTTEVGAKLFAIAQGRFGFTELTDAIQPIIPAIKSANVGFDEMVGALGNLLDEGYSPKQAAKQLKEFAAEGTNGAAKIRELAGDTVSTAEAMERLRVAAQTNREEAGNLSNILRAQLNAELIDLGNEILPTVNSGLISTIGLIRTFRQTIGSESLFAGLEFNLPESGPQLRTFIAQNEKLLADVRRQVEGLADAADKANRIHLVDLLSIGGVASRPGRTGQATAGLQETLDFITRIEQATEQAKQKLSELRNGALPDMAATAPRITDADRKRAADAVKRRLDETKRMGEDLARTVVEMERTIFRGERSAVEAIADELREYGEALQNATPEQRAFGGELIKSANELAKLQDLLAKAKLEGFDPAPQVTTQVQLQIKGVDIERQKLQIGRVRHELSEEDRKKQEASDRKHISALNDQATILDQSVLSAFRIADAFGLADEHIGGILSGLSGVASGIVPLVEALRFRDADGKLDLGMIGGAALPLAGSVAGLIDGIRSAFAESPELTAAREALERVAVELRQNTLGLQAFRASGDELGRIEQAIAEFVEKGLPGLFEGRSRVSPQRVTEELERFGLTMDDLREFAADANLPFVELTREALPQFLQFLEAMGIKLDQIQQQGFFGSGASGRLEGARAGFRFSQENETGGDMVAGLINAALGGDKVSTILRQAFAGIDLTKVGSDPAVQEAVRVAIRGLFTQVTAEGFSDFEGLGDFSGGEFIAFLEELLGLLPELAAVPVDPAAAVSEALAAFSRSTRVFDTSTKDQATQFLGILAGFSPALAELLGQVNPEHIEGLDHATGLLQDFFTRVESGEISLEGTGLTVELLVDAIDRLQAASQEAKDEVERLAAEEERRAEELRREAERQREEAEREAQRAQEEARRRAAEADADRIATGNAAIQRLREEFALFDIDDVVDQLQEMAGLLQARGPIFQQLLGGLDLADPTARSEALARLQQFAVQNPLGVSSGTFGAATTRSAALELAEMIKRANEVAVTGGGQSGSFAISRTITEAGADRISGLIGTGNILLGEIASHTAAIAAALGATALPPLTPPAIAPTSSRPVIGTSSFHVQIIVNGTEVSGGLSPATTDSIRRLAQDLMHDAARAAMGA